MGPLPIVVSVAAGLLAYGLLAAWYVIPALDRRTRADALVLLLVPHWFRYIGLAFVLPGVAGDLPSDFAVPAAVGDLVAVVLAFLAAVAVRRGWAFAIPAVWTFNVFGTLDLVYAIVQGLLNVPDPGSFGAAYFIPTVVVPGLLVSHGLIFRVLLKRAGA